MTLPLLDNLDAVRERIVTCPDLFVVLDYDGTLTQIVDRPEQAWIETDTRQIVANLARRPRVKVVIASGRAHDDLRLRVGIPDLIYVGNHGLEMHGPGFTFDRIAPDTTESDLSRVCTALREQLKDIPGILMENKRLSISVHYRRTPEDLIGNVREIVAECVCAWPDRLRIIEGLKVFDVQPNVNWNKGAASAWLRRVLNLEKALSISIGDDRTDEDLFLALSDGVTIKVGVRPDTNAAYQVPGLSDVKRFLQWLTECPSEANLLPVA